jgi:hypothetical protein
LQRESTHVGQIIHLVLRKTGELTGGLDFPIAVICTKAFRNYIEPLFRVTV